MGLKNRDGRDRRTVKTALDLNKPEEAEILEEIIRIKKQRTFKTFFKQALTLFTALQEGNIKPLMQLFPGVVSEISGVPISRIIKAVADRTPEPIPAKKSRAAGFVYLLKIETSPPYYKIGASRKPDIRIHQVIGAESPFDYALVHVIPTEDMFHLEGELHRKYQGKHVKGEWFALDGEDIEEIKVYS